MDRRDGTCTGRDLDQRSVGRGDGGRPAPQLVIRAARQDQYQWKDDCKQN